MNRRRLIVALAASVAVVAAVVLTIALALIPLPEFADLPAGRLTGSIAFADGSNCLQVADLGTGTVTELRCETEDNSIGGLSWTSEGVAMTTYLNQPFTKVLDPSSGEVIETRFLDDNEPYQPDNDPMDGLFIDQSEHRALSLLDQDGSVLIRLAAPENYWIEAAARDPSGDLVAISDSTGRLGVFEIGGSGPFLIADNVRSWPPPVWAP